MRVRFVHPVTYSVAGGRREGRRSHGTTIDLSLGGVRFEAETRLMMGDVLDLEIGTGETVLRARARVVHVTSSDVSRGLEAGAEFVELDDEAKLLLRSLTAPAGG